MHTQVNSPDGDGLVHYAIDEIFKQLSNKAVAIGGSRKGIRPGTRLGYIGRAWARAWYTGLRPGVSLG